MSVQGAGALHSRLRAIGNTHELFRQMQLAVVREQKKLVPRKTGNLGRSIRPGTITATYAEVIATADYAAATNFGSRPHDILPKTRKALRFAAPGAARRLSGRARKGAAVIFAKKVRHPGTKGTHWAERGVAAAVGRGRLADVIIEAWNRAG